MTQFAYTARSKQGALIDGTMDAESERTVASRLGREGNYALEIKQCAGSSTQSSISPPERSVVRISQNELIQFTSQCGSLLKAGIPLLRALTLLTEQSSRIGNSVINTIAQEIQKGQSLSETLEMFPRIFSTMYVSIVHVGEEAGILAEMLERLAKTLDDQRQLRGKLKAAMMYPLFLSCIGLATMIVLTVWVIPRFESFFVSLQNQLPLATRIVLAASAYVVAYWPIIIAVLVFTGIMLASARKNTYWRTVLDSSWLKLPIIGPIIIKSQLAQFARTLGTLLGHGVNLIKALEITSATMSNIIFVKRIENACGGIIKGCRLSQSFTKDAIFSSAVLGVLAVGEESGNLAEMLLKLASQYEQENERQIRTFTNMIEPAMILIMGSVVGFVVIAMLMPIFKASTLVH